MIQINKIISIGGNCISFDFTKHLGVRECGPVDNFAEFNIWKSAALFSNEIKKNIFKEKYQTRKATETEKKQFYFCSKVYTFEKGFRYNDPQFLEGRQPNETIWWSCTFFGSF